MAKMKTYTLDEVMDEDWGKYGFITPTSWFIESMT